MVEAKRIIADYRKRAVEIEGRPDLSDVQELKVRLIRRDGLVDTQGLLHRLEVMVAEGCTRAEYEKLAGTIWDLAGVVWKDSRRLRVADREAELEHQRLHRPQPWQPEQSWLNWTQQQEAKHQRLHGLQRKAAAE